MEIDTLPINKEHITVVIPSLSRGEALQKYRELMITYIRGIDPKILKYRTKVN